MTHFLVLFAALLLVFLIARGTYDAVKYIYNYNSYSCQVQMNKGVIHYGYLTIGETRYEEYTFRWFNKNTPLSEACRRANSSQGHRVIDFWRYK